MVNVEFFCDKFGFQAMELRGHAEYNPGNDVVCAGISSLALTMAQMLRNLAASFRRFQIDDGVTVEIEPFIEIEDQLIVDAVFTFALTGLRMIEQQYPGAIRIKEMTL